MRQHPLRRVLVLIFAASLAASLGGLARAQEEVVPTPAATGVIQGSSYTAGDERLPQRFLILVIPSDTPQPVRIEEFAPQGDPLRTDEAPSSRAGFGLVRPDVRGDYSVTGLEAGEYFVISIAPSVDYDVRPPEQVMMSQRDQTTTVPAFRVNVREGGTTTVNIVFAGPPVPTGPSSITICITTFDRNTLDTVQDTVVSIDIDPPVDGVTITIDAEGCAVIGNIPAGTYTFALETELGFTDSFTEDVEPGADGRVERGIRPALAASVTDLPTTGSAGGGGWGMLPVVLGFAVFAAGAIAFGVLRRRSA